MDGRVSEHVRAVKAADRGERQAERFAAAPARPWRSLPLSAYSTGCPATLLLTGRARLSRGQATLRARLRRYRSIGCFIGCGPPVEWPSDSSAGPQGMFLHFASAAAATSTAGHGLCVRPAHCSRTGACRHHRAALLLWCVLCLFLCPAVHSGGGSTQSGQPCAMPAAGLASAAALERGLGCRAGAGYRAQG